MSESRHCGVCSLSEADHLTLQSQGKIRHKFSLDGQLIPMVTEQPKPKNLVAIPDPALRALLLEKGIITYEELASKEVEILGRQRVPTTPQVDG